MATSTALADENRPRQELLDAAAGVAAGHPAVGPEGQQRCPRCEVPAPCGQRRTADEILARGARFDMTPWHPPGTLHPDDQRRASHQP